MTRRSDREHVGLAWKATLLAAALALHGCSGSSSSPAGGGGGSSGGAVAFSRSFGGPGSDYIDQAIQTSDGGYAFVGDVRTTGGVEAAWFAKLDALGNVEWQRLFSTRPETNVSVGGIEILDVAPTSDGGYCAVGRAAGESSDFYVRRIDASGQRVWDLRFDSGGWAGYDMVPGGGGSVAASSDHGTTVVAGEGTRCFIAGHSFANLRERSENQFPHAPGTVHATVTGSGTLRTFLGAASTVVALIDAGEVRWMQRLTDGAFRSHDSDDQKDNDRYRPDLKRDGDGIVLVRNVADRFAELVAFDSGGGRRAHRTFWLREYTHDRLGVRVFAGASAYYISSVRSSPVIDELRNEVRLLATNRSGELLWEQRSFSASSSYTGFNHAPHVGEICNALECVVAAVGGFRFDELQADGTTLWRHVLGIRLMNIDSGALIARHAFADTYITDVEFSASGVARVLSCPTWSCRPDADANPRSYRFDTFQIGGASSLLTSSIEIPQNDYGFDIHQKLSAGEVIRLQGRSIRRFRADGSEREPIDVLPPYDHSIPPAGRGTAKVIERTPGEFIVASDPMLFAFNRNGIRWALGRQHTYRASMIEATYALLSHPDGGVVKAGTLPVHINADGRVVSEGDELVAGDHIGPSRTNAASGTRDGGYWLATNNAVLQYLSPGGTGEEDPELRPRWVQRLVRYDADGRIVRVLRVPEVLSPIMALAATADDGVILLSGTDESVLEGLEDGTQFEPASPVHVLVRLDASGAVVWARRYTIPGEMQPQQSLNTTQRWYEAERLPGPWSHARRGVAALPDGGYAFAFTSRGLYGSGAMVPRYGNPDSNNPFPLGNNDVSIMRVDPEGRPLWVRVHGALDHERITGFSLTDDGGFLVAGDSASFDAVTPFTQEGWVMRLGADARISEGCNAYLGEIHGGLVRHENFEVAMEPTAPELGSGQSALEPITVYTYDPESGNDARQCSAPAATTLPATGPLPELLQLRVQPVSSEGIPDLVHSTPTGIHCSSTDMRFCARNFVRGATATLAVDDSAARYFQGWSGDCREVFRNPYRCLVNMIEDETIEARFGDPGAARAQLSISVTGGGRAYTLLDNGIDCRAEDGGTAACAEDYAFGLPVRLTVEPDAGEQFQGWGGACARYGSTAVFDLTMDEDAQCTARFSGGGAAPPPPPPPPRRLTVAILLDGQPSSTGGNVTAPGIACGAAGADCEEDYADGAVVALLATPLAGYDFAGWSSNGTAACATATATSVTLTMNAAHHCTARFTSPTTGARLTMLVDTNGLTPPVIPIGGRVTSSPAGIDCGPAQTSCDTRFPFGSTVSLTAVAEPGFQFVRWYSYRDPLSPCNLASANLATISLTLGADTHCRANFAALPTNPGGATNELRIIFATPPTRPAAFRVLDVDRHLVDCVENCIVTYPHGGGPVRLRGIDQYSGFPVPFNNCDRFEPDALDPSGGQLCVSDIHLGNRMIVIE